MDLGVLRGWPLSTGKTLCRISAQPARIHHFNQQRTWPVFWIAEAIVHYPHDVEANVEADEVCKCQRPHRVRHSKLEHLVHGFRCRNAFHNRVNRFVNERHEDSIRDETGSIVHLDGSLLELQRELLDRRVRFIAGGNATDDLDQFHHRNRIEKVHADDLVRPLGNRRQLGDRNRRSIRGENNLGPANLVEVAENFRFDVELFRGRFDDKIGLREILAAERATNPAESRRLLLGSDLVLCDFPVEVFRNRVETAIEKPLLYLH